MAARSDCEYCPFKDDDKIDCHVLKSGHTRFCKLINPNYSEYKSNMFEAIKRLTLEPLGLYKSEYPNVLQQVSNLTKSVYKYINTGGGIVSSDVKNKRLEICKSCEFYDIEQIRCTSCGCYLNIKTSLPSESCPLSPPKWKPVEIKNQPKAGGCNCSN